MFSKEIEKLTRQLLQQPPSPAPAPTPNGLEEEVGELKDEIEHLKKQVAIEKEIHAAVGKRYEEQIASLNIEQISREF